MVQHTYRESNKVAHNLAKFALTVNEEQVWIESGPEGFHSFLLHDKLGIVWFLMNIESTIIIQKIKEK